MTDRQWRERIVPGNLGAAAGMWASFFFFFLDSPGAAPNLFGRSVKVPFILAITSESPLKQKWFKKIFNNLLNIRKNSVNQLKLCGLFNISYITEDSLKLDFHLVTYFKWRYEQF